MILYKKLKIFKILISMNVKGNAQIKKEGKSLLVEIVNISSSDMGIVIGKEEIL